MKDWENEFDELYDATKNFGYCESEYPMKEVIEDEEKNKEQFKTFIRNLIKEPEWPPEKKLNTDIDMEHYFRGYNQGRSDTIKAWERSK